MLLSLKFMGPLKLIQRAPSESMDLRLRTSVMEERREIQRERKEIFFFFPSKPPWLRSQTLPVGGAVGLCSDYSR